MPGTVARILALQQAAGNDAVATLLVAESSSVQRQPAQAPNALAAAPAPHPELSAGASGPAVSELQEKLSVVVAESKLTVSGRFGSHTEEVVKRFQVEAGLRPDGIVGPDTWGALDSLRGGTEVAGATLARIQALRTEGDALFDAGDFQGALAKYMSIYSDPAAAHKGARGGLVYSIASCQHQLGRFAEAISFYEEVMGLPAVGAELGGSAAENLRRARLQQPFQRAKDMEAERAAFAP